MGLDLVDSVIDVTHFLLCYVMEIQNAALLNNLTELQDDYNFFQLFFKFKFSLLKNTFSY